jgi:NAD(P) transhydrogenase
MSQWAEDMVSEYDYDLVVIGSGPAGEKGAAQAAYWGKRVALIERADHLGGAGINTGTLPSKTLRETALYFSGLRQRGLYGIDYSLKDNLTISDFLFRKQVVIENEWKIIQRNLDRHGIDLIWGEGGLKDAHTVRIDLREGGQRDLTAQVILVATGSSPFRPDGVPFGNNLVYDSDTILRMDRIPGSMAIIGGGVIGSEYACIFTALGVAVTLIDGRDRLLPFIDSEISGRLQAELERLGLRFMFNERVESTHTSHDRVQMSLSGGETLEVECALFAAGRSSNVEGLGLEAVGVEMGRRGLVMVNDKYQTSVPNIYAAGDVIGFPALASTSMEQARVAMVHAFNLPGKEQLSPVLPFAIYTIPEISMAGLSEDECREKGIPYLVGRSFYDKSPRGQIIGDMSGMLKLIFSPHSKKLLGVYHIGEMSSELVHIGTHVLAHEGTIDEFIKAVYNYPSLADSYKYAAYDGLGRWERWCAENPSEASAGP